MKRTILCVVALVVFAALPLTVHAQAPAPSPSPTPAAACSGTNCGLHFLTEANVYQNSDGTTAQAYSVEIPAWSNVRFGLKEVLNPDAKGNESFVTVGYGKPLGKLLPNLSSGSSLNLNNIVVYGSVGLGDEQQVLTGATTKTTRSAAIGAWAGARVKIGTIAGATTTAGFSVGYVAVPGSHEHFFLGKPSQFQIAPGIQLAF